MHSRSVLCILGTITFLSMYVCMYILGTARLRELHRAETGMASESLSVCWRAQSMPDRYVLCLPVRYLSWILCGRCNRRRRQRLAVENCGSGTANQTKAGLQNSRSESDSGNSHASCWFFLTGGGPWLVGATATWAWWTNQEAAVNCGTCTPMSTQSTC